MGDEIALARMHELNIDPKTLARRLLYVNSWGMFDHLAFHADPHPANILVRANNELVFVDFGACGFMNRVQRDFFAQTFADFQRDDVWDVARWGGGGVRTVAPYQCDEPGER
jgi:ubiquinone biosynthesis protein